MSSSKDELYRLQRRGFLFPNDAVNKIPLTIPWLGATGTLPALASQIVLDNSLVQPPVPPYDDRVGIHPDWINSQRFGYHMFRAMILLHEIMAYRRELQLFAVSPILSPEAWQSFLTPHHPSFDAPIEEQKAYDAFFACTKTMSYDRIAEALETRWIHPATGAYTHVVYSLTEKKRNLLIRDLPGRLHKAWGTVTDRIVIAFETLSSAEVVKHVNQHNFIAMQHRRQDWTPNESDFSRPKSKRAARSHSDKGGAQTKKKKKTRKSGKGQSKSKSDKPIKKKKAKRTPTKKTRKKDADTKDEKKDEGKQVVVVAATTPTKPQPQIIEPIIQLFAISGQLSSHFCRSELFPYAYVVTDPMEIHHLTKAEDIKDPFQHRKTLSTDPAAQVYETLVGGQLVYMEPVSDRGIVNVPTLVVDDFKSKARPI